MLVLGRRQYQSIYIGEDIVLTVIKINRDTIQLGIQAPPDIVILREELAPYDENKNLKCKGAIKNYAA